MEELLSEVMTRGIKRFMKKRSIILYQGEIPRSSFVIRKGIVKMYSINNAGDEQLAAFYVTGDILPDTWVFGKSTSVLYYYEALTDCELYALPREDLRGLIMENQRLLTYMFDSMVASYSGLLMRITALEQSRAREKILHTLYYLMFRYGSAQPDGTYAVRLGLTHTNIAEMIGLTRETIAGELSKFKKKGIVSYNAREYRIHKERLERLLGEDRFDDLVR